MFCISAFVISHNVAALVAKCNFSYGAKGVEASEVFCRMTCLSTVVISARKNSDSY